MARKKKCYGACDDCPSCHARAKAAAENRDPVSRTASLAGPIVAAGIAVTGAFAHVGEPVDAGQMGDAQDIYVDRTYGNDVEDASHQQGTGTSQRY